MNLNESDLYKFIIDNEKRKEEHKSNCLSLKHHLSEKCMSIYGYSPSQEELELLLAFNNYELERCEKIEKELKNQIKPCQ